MCGPISALFAILSKCLVHHCRVVKEEYLVIILGYFFLNPYSAEPGYTLPLQNSVDPDQLASKEAN